MNILIDRAKKEEVILNFNISSRTKLIYLHLLGVPKCCNRYLEPNKKLISKFDLIEYPEYAKCFNELKKHKYIVNKKDV